MEDRRTTLSPHALVNPPELGPAAGFAHAVVPAEGRTVYLGGQTAQGADGRIIPGDLAEQFDTALGNVVTALRAAGGQPGHLVSVVIYTTDLPAYRESLAPVGDAHRRHLGKHYPAMALFGVTGLFDPEALVELVATAVVPD